MKGKTIVILLVAGLLLSSIFMTACQKKQPEPFKKNPDRPAVKPLTDAERFQKAIAPFKAMLDVAVVLDEGVTKDDPIYKNMVALREKLKTTPFKDLKPEDLHGGVPQGPFPGVKPGEIHPKLAEVLTGVGQGQPSKIMFAEGIGYAVVYLAARNDTAGTVDIGVILLPVTPEAKPSEGGKAAAGTGGPSNAKGSASPVNPTK